MSGSGQLPRNLPLTVPLSFILFQGAAIKLAGVVQNPEQPQTEWLEWRLRVKNIKGEETGFECDGRLWPRLPFEFNAAVEVCLTWEFGSACKNTLFLGALNRQFSFLNYIH